MKRTLIFGALFLFGIMAGAQSYVVNSEKSTVKWVGKKVGKSHNGEVGLKSGSFEIKDNKFVSGTFVMNMNEMSDENGTDTRLVGHLKSDDFFSVEKFPEAKLVITGSEEFKKGEAMVKGNLTIKGITKPIEFKVLQKGVTFTSSMVFDRSLYEVKYGSGKFFENLGDKAIMDDVEISVTLIAMRQK
jgi:polyisoprenoid-binding protein YceI